MVELCGDMGFRRERVYKDMFRQLEKRLQSGD